MKHLSLILLVLPIVGCVPPQNAATTGAPATEAARTAPTTQQQCATCVTVSGRNFARPTLGDVRLGQTTKSDILEKFGTPISERSVNKPPENTGANAPSSKFATAPIVGTMTTMFYQYGRGGQSVPGGAQVRTALFTLVDDKLVGFTTPSNFVEDSTNFDENRFSMLKKGVSTERDVIATLGTPAGHMIYPLTKERGQKKMLYSYSRVDVVAKRVTIRTAVVLIEADGRLNDYWIDSSTTNLPAGPQAPASNFKA